jgi:translation initiation factor 6
MHVAKQSIEGNSLVGLYMVPLDDVVFVAPSVSEEQRKTIAQVFQAEVIELTIAGTGLLGIFLATNGSELLVPSVLFDHEEEVLKKSGVSFHIFETTQSCLGNNIVATKKGALIAPGFSDEEKKALEAILKTPLKEAMLHEATTIGSYIACNDTHGLASYEFSDEQLDDFEKFLGIKLDTGTVNLGATQVHSGIAVNNNGFIIGEQSGGPEVVHADFALGFLED